MPDDPKPTLPERDRTDESLRIERRSADVALQERKREIEREADEIVQTARDTADALVADARDQADTHLAAHPQTIVAAERQIEDATLAAERASADASIGRERDAREALARLLPMEREKTDRYLRTERTRSDNEISHRDDFLGIVSHDLRNLLGGISLTATMMAERAAPTEDGARTIEGATRIQRYTARMNRLIGDLVDISSIEAGRLAMNITCGNTTAALDEAIDMFRGLAEIKGLTLSRAPGGELTGEFDHDRMIQVLANLITNAIKFTERGGTIVVRNLIEDGRIRIAVTDTGVGIPRDKLESVFERFWQIGKQDARGVGLGLYISRCIVEAHGGKIWAQSVLGEGSTFNFTLAL